MAAPTLARDSVEFRTGATVKVATASWRSTRGFTMLDAILEECAFYRSEESANPDEEILTAIRPALLTVPDARLYGISSPYARRGILWAAYERYFGRDARGTHAAIEGSSCASLRWRTTSLKSASTIVMACKSRSLSK